MEQPNVPQDLKVDWDTLNVPYVSPSTLEWAIERDKNMQRFAKQLIERVGAAEQRATIAEAKLARVQENIRVAMTMPEMMALVAMAEAELTRRQAQPA